MAGRQPAQGAADTALSLDQREETEPRAWSFPRSWFFRSMILPKFNLTSGKTGATVPVFREGGGGEMQGVTSGMSMEAGEEGLGRGGWDSMASDTWTHSPALG